MFKPMLAATIKDPTQLKYPLLGTPKIDGIRCVVHPYQGALTRSLKPVPNNYVRAEISKWQDRLNWCDGELTVGDGFQSTTSGIMSHSGRPAFTFHVFDIVPLPLTIGDKWLVNYPERLEHNKRFIWKAPFVKVLIPTAVHNSQDLKQYVDTCLEQGYEGACFRSINSPYKFGRSTLKQQWLLKYKQFEDSDAVIVAFNELMHNDNDAETNETGYKQRSTHQANMIPMGVLGSFRVRDLITNLEFNVGTGFNASQRKEYWDKRDSLLGKLIKYRHQPHGQKELPRIPVFLGLRDGRDTSKPAQEEFNYDERILR